MPRSAAAAVKTYSPFVGFCFIINYIVGTGFLGIPYVFWNTGVIAGVATLVVISMAIAIPAIWTLEVMARAQAIDDVDSSRVQADSEMKAVFRIETDRHFEVSELCRIFLGRVGGAVYLVLILIYLFIGQWLTGPVAGTAWSSNLPLNFGTFRQCSQADFNGVLHPSDGCWNSYALCILFFAIIVVPLSCLDLKEQEIVQVTLSITRFVVITSIIIYSIVAEVKGYKGHESVDPPPNSTVKEHVLGFKMNGFLATLPVVIYAQMLHVAIPSLVQPINDKRHLGRLFWLIFATTSVIYGVLGVTAAVYLKYSVNEQCTLNWADTTSSGHSMLLRVYSYFVVIFPSLDVLSAYPLGAIIMANMVEYLFTGNPRVQSGRFFVTVNRFVWATLPLICSVYLSDLVELDKFAGLPAFCAAFIFPAFLQWRSVKMCQNRFGTSITPYTSRWVSGFGVVGVVFAFGVVITIATFVSFFLPHSLA